MALPKKIKRGNLLWRLEGNEPETRGRAIIVDDYPGYKLITYGDPEDSTSVPSFEFYSIADDENELSPLSIAALTGDALNAYNACLAVDATLGGGYSD